MTRHSISADDLEASGKAPWQGPQPIEDHAKMWKGRLWVPLEAAIADVQFWQRRDYEHGTTYALADQRDERGGEAPKGLSSSKPLSGATGGGMIALREALEQWRLKDGYVPAYIAGNNMMLDKALELAAQLAAPTDTRGGESALRDSERLQWHQLLVQMLARCEAAGLESVDTLHQAVSSGIAALASPAAPGGVLPDGWVAVPVEPTEDMLDAYWKQTGESKEMRPRTHAYMRRYWSALLAVRPPLSGDRT